jgi:hypothetical protein
MKGSLEHDTLDHLSGLLLSSAMTTLLAAESLGATQAVYINEEDADKIKPTPCFLLKPNGWRSINATVGGYIYEFAVIVCAYVHITPSEGIPAAHEKAATYLGCAMDLLFTSHSYEAGYWITARPDEPAALDDMLQEALGELGRSSCHQIVLQVPVDYT